MPAVGVLGDSVVHREGSPRQSPACEGQQDRSHELELNDAFHEVANGGRAPLPAKALSHVLAGASSGHSMPCCQVVQPDTSRRAVTRVPSTQLPPAWLPPITGHLQQQSSTFLWANGGPFPGERNARPYVLGQPRLGVIKMTRS